jgi:hypothetical protein
MWAFLAVHYGGEARATAKATDDDKHRIMHEQIKKGKFIPWLKFFFECGALDEIADRNNNGVIDAIDDTLELIKSCKKKVMTKPVSIPGIRRWHT